MIFPMRPGVNRCVADQTSLDDRSLPTLDEIQTHVDDAGLSNLRLSEPEWMSYFAVNERVATRNRVGRVFFLGDASPIHRPVGGPVMDPRVADASTLRWKLHTLAHGR